MSLPRFSKVEWIEKAETLIQLLNRMYLITGLYPIKYEVKDDSYSCWIELQFPHRSARIAFEMVAHVYLQGACYPVNDITMEWRYC